MLGGVQHDCSISSSQLSRFRQEISDRTHLEPLDRISLRNLVRETDLGHLLLALRHSVTRAVEHNVEVHAVDAYKEVGRVEKRVHAFVRLLDKYGEGW